MDYFTLLIYTYTLTRVLYKNGGLLFPLLRYFLFFHLKVCYGPCSMIKTMNRLHSFQFKGGNCMNTYVCVKFLESPLSALKKSP